KQWDKFALRYNGPAAVAMNDYPKKLEDAFDTFERNGPPDIRVRIAQLALTFLGLDPGIVDGLLGNRTRTAMQRFQTNEGLAQTNELTDETLDALVKKVFGGKVEA